MKRILMILATLSLVLGACGEKGGQESAGGGGEAAPEKAAPAGPESFDAAGLFKAFGETKGMDAMKRWKPGVIVKGKVLRTITEMDESMKVWLDAGEGNYISLTFSDKGAAAKEAKLDKGADVDATCKSVGGGMDKYVMLLDCELKK